MSEVTTIEKIEELNIRFVNDLIHFKNKFIKLDADIKTLIEKSKKDSSENIFFVIQ